MRIAIIFSIIFIVVTITVVLLGLLMPANYSCDSGNASIAGDYKVIIEDKGALWLLDSMYANNYCAKLDCQAYNNLTDGSTRCLV